MSCLAVTKSFTFSGALSNQRCAVRITENPARYDACSSAPTYPPTLETKCTQVSIASAPIRSTCSGINNCTAQDAECPGCWVQAFNGDLTFEGIFSRLDGWIQSGPSCDKDAYSYLAPCPYSKCRTGEHSRVRRPHWL